MHAQALRQLLALTLIGVITGVINVASSVAINLIATELQPSFQGHGRRTASGPGQPPGLALRRL